MTENDDVAHIFMSSKKELRIYVTDGINLWRIYTAFIGGDGSFYYKVPSAHQFLAGKFSQHPTGTRHFKTTEDVAKYRVFGWPDFEKLTIVPIDSFGFRVDGPLADDPIFKELKKEKIKKPALVNGSIRPSILTVSSGTPASNHSTAAASRSMWKCPFTPTTSGSRRNERCQEATADFGSPAPVQNTYFLVILVTSEHRRHRRRNRHVNRCAGLLRVEEEAPVLDLCGSGRRVAPRQCRIKGDPVNRGPL